MYNIDPTHLRQDGKLKNNAPLEIKGHFFINKCIDKFGYKFDYSKIKWKGVHKEVTIICPDHGEFTQTPKNHFDSKLGCQKCAKSKTIYNKLTHDEILKQCNEYHENYYDYSLVSFTSLNDKNEVAIICPEHGEYKTRIYNHYTGRGKCPNCYQRSSGFYCQGYFDNHPEQKDIEGVLYYVRLYNDTESFYKVGITKHSANKRFFIDDKVPYNVEIIKEKNMTLYDAFELEQKILSEYADYKVTPKLRFHGYTECLNYDIRNIL